MNNNKNHNSNDVLWWGLIILCLCTVWPFGLFLLFMKIFKNKPDFNAKATTGPAATPTQGQANQASRANQTSPGAATLTEEEKAALRQKFSQGAQTAAPYASGGTYQRWSQPPTYNRSSDRQSQTANGQRTAQGGFVSPKEAKKEQRANRRRTGKAMRIVGGILTGVFGFAAVETLLEDLYSGVSAGTLIQDVNPLMLFCCLGIGLLAFGIQRGRQNKRLSRYKTLMGPRPTLDLHMASEATGIKYSTVLDDVQKMTDRGEFGNAFVDVARGMLILDGGNYTPPQSEPDPTAQSVAADAVEVSRLTDNEVLTKIRDVNDAIANPEISRQIDEIGMLTAKIFQLVDENPEKEQEIRSFTAYYLPQTLKILNAYARLERQGVEGQNITEAKARIEAMLDKLVSGYANQLDRLFGSEMLDITTDITVMEQMLARDGLVLDEMQMPQKKPAPEQQIMQYEQ